VYDCRETDSREAGITAATNALKAGRLVVVPTDTLYGLAANAFDGEAVTSLLRAKGRGRDMPVPVLVGSWHTIEGLVSFVAPRTWDLIEAFWPGGLTLVVEQAPSLAWDLGDARGTVAVRMPLHPVAIELLETTGPMAVSSANKSPPARTAQEAQDQLGDEVAVYLDGGPAHTGVASTIVDVTAEVPRILRAGAIDAVQLRTVVADIAG
jgi:tRNA threonylcarbamoyl adenosine modification protein (Sua5/YciO/YrdC/YwlC family)